MAAAVYRSVVRSPRGHAVGTFRNVVVDVRSFSGRSGTAVVGQPAGQCQHQQRRLQQGFVAGRLRRGGRPRRRRGHVTVAVASHVSATAAVWTSAVAAGTWTTHTPSSGGTSRRWNTASRTLSASTTGAPRFDRDPTDSPRTHRWPRPSPSVVVSHVRPVGKRLNRLGSSLFYLPPDG